MIKTELLFDLLGIHTRHLKGALIMTRLIAIGLATLIGLAVLPVFGDQDTIAAGDNDGFIYGRITTTSGKEYEGFLRWDDEEAFWDDLFHSTKTELPYYEDFEDIIEEQDRDSRKRDKSTIQIFSWRFSIDGDNWGSSSRLFISRFGDIEKIRVTDDDEAEITMKNGEIYDVEGYSNDVGAKIFVNDTSLGDVRVRWNRIDTIEFMPVAGNADPGVFRLAGRVETDSGVFEGYIQWDKEECLSTDILDGDDEDGSLEIEMGKIASITRRGRNSSIVEMKDGREMRLRGTNDVNDENRGIMVEDHRFGRVTIPWDEFDNLTFQDLGSGRSYDDFPVLGRLEGTVTDIDGEKYTGYIVFDLDEAEGWEMFNGDYHDMEYDIPFANIKTIEPLGHDDVRVVLFNGEEFELEDSQDASDSNDGILILDERGRDPEYVVWEDVELIEFKR